MYTLFSKSLQGIQSSSFSECDASLDRALVEPGHQGLLLGELILLSGHALIWVEQALALEQAQDGQLRAPHHRHHSSLL